MNFTMKTTTLTTIILTAVALSGFAFLGLTEAKADFLPTVGTAIGYAAAVVILALAATDSRRTKRLS